MLLKQKLEGWVNRLCKLRFTWLGVNVDRLRDATGSRLWRERVAVVADMGIMAIAIEQVNGAPNSVILCSRRSLIDLLVLYTVGTIQHCF
jgi:hypothetical protein